MKINGRAIAENIYQDLKTRTEKLKELNVIPHLAVFLIGDDPASLAYIKQKRKWSEFIGAQFSLIQYPITVSADEVIVSISHLNNSSDVHGIIVQRPLPKHIDIKKITEAIDAKKDVDGFRPDSPFSVPVAAAVMKVLKEIHDQKISKGDFNKWLNKQSIVVIGKGETAGGPIIRHLLNDGIIPQVVYSKTINPESLTKDADIIISAVGKSEILKPDMIKKEAIVLGVGMHKGSDEKLHGDFNEEAITEFVSDYTPTPGGIGPINVAFLLSNLVEAAENSIKN